MESSFVRKIKTICVSCGVSFEKERVYVIEANALGLEMVKREIDMAYGRGCLGFVGCVSYAMFLGHGHVFVPEDFTKKGLTK